MKKFLFSLAASAFTILATSATSQDVTLFGQLYNGNGDHGIFKFSSGDNATMERVADIVAEPNCGAVKAGDRFYTLSAEAGEYGAEYAAYVYDASDGYTLITRIGSAWGIAKPQQVLAYNPVDSKIYTAYQESGYYGTESYLGILDISNRTITQIGYGSLYFGYGNTYIVAMAFNPDGELFAIASNSNLYKVNTGNADLTYVGSTGIYPEYEQSMTFSPEGDEIFWAACNDDINALYSVDPATASVSKIKDFTNNEEFVTLWAGDVEAAPNAPAAPEDIAVEFTDGSLSGTITFTAPGLTHSGDELEGEIAYEVFANDAVVGSGSTNPGEKAACLISVPASGLYDFKVVLSNSAGKGGSATLSGIYVGKDTPMGVENLKLTRGDSDSEFVVTWDNPTSGAHGGYVDLSSVKYRVRRLPSFDVVSEDATSPFIDTFDSSEPVKLSYEVMPYMDENISGLPLTTNRIMVGEAYDTPWSEDFTSYSAAQIWTVADANDDGHSWEYQWDFGYFRIYDNENAKNDWLISPYIKMEAGYDYEVSFDVRTIATEELEVKAGTGLEPDDMTYTVLECETIPDSDYTWLTRKCTFACKETGNHHIGFHAMASDPYNALALYIDNVKVEKKGLSSVDDIRAESTSSIVVEHNGIRAIGAAEVEIYTVDGRKFTSASLADGETLPLPSGCYIVRSADTSIKAMIR